MSDTRQQSAEVVSTLVLMDPFKSIVDKFLLASDEFTQKLVRVCPGQWTVPTPCTEWNVRQLVNHMTRGNLNYAALASGGTGAEFLRLRDVDALGTDPVAAFADSVWACSQAFSRPGVLARKIDYPLGVIRADQALAVRMTDSIVHTWDLARAVGADDRLDPGLVDWINANARDIYAGLAETPVSASGTHLFFKPLSGELPADAAAQTRLLHLMGRR